ncbi:MAG: GIY-YIG nuclease family protein [bacterium]
MYYTYVAKEERKKKYYIGHTNNLEDQLRKYNAPKKVGAKLNPAVFIMHYESYPTEFEAVKREKEFKKFKGNIEAQFTSVKK